MSVGILAWTLSSIWSSRDKSMIAVFHLFVYAFIYSLDRFLYNSITVTTREDPNNARTTSYIDHTLLSLSLMQCYEYVPVRPNAINMFQRGSHLFHHFHNAYGSACPDRAR